jgi:ATP-binding cassette subfamily B protein
LPDPPRGDIRFDRVSFGYGQEDPVLRAVSFTIGRGEQVALVGATGVGKSTVAGLLVRFFTPEDGVIRLDGIETDELSLADLRKAVCVVEQGPFLFSGPLIDNIRYGSWDAPRQRVDEAIRLAGLEPLVAALPHGVDSPIEESGRDLSGGEKQRIALARAIVRDPAVLVLDEATSAIDSQTEAIVFEGLRLWMARRTVVAITHRLATAIRFPRCIVLDGGRVAGDGSPEVLLKTCPAFAGLFREQLDPLDINRGSRL